MLAEIYVENFALIEKLQIEFHSGLNILTGETGAGKSLLTDAVGMLNGGKGDRDLIRRGTGKALVEGTFRGPFSAGIIDFCNEAGIDSELIVISREMNTEGKNVVRVNGRRVTLSFLEELSPMLMNMHSQTEHFSLFQEDAQLILLDRFGGEEILAQKEKTKSAYRNWQEKKTELNDVKAKISDREERLDFLKYRCREIEAYHFMPDEEESVRAEIALLASGKARYEDAQLIYEALNGNNGGAVAALYDSLEAIKRISQKDAEMADKAEALNDIYYSLADIADEIGAYKGSIEIDPIRLEDLEQRLSDIKKAEKKYGRDIPGILEYYREMQAEIETLTDSEFVLENLTKAEQAALADLKAEAEALTEIRKKFGQALAEAIQLQLREMYLPNAEFSVAFQDIPLSAEGKDKIIFMASMNKGEELKPLAKVASGGEISRVLLAAKIILGKLDAVQTMIFDEIDSGLGGETAGKIGEKLKVLGNDLQVFAVTHSPLVAAYADHHYYIQKQEHNDRVTVGVTELTQEQIPTEIARMLSGDKNSAVSLKQAEELLQKTV